MYSHYAPRLASLPLACRRPVSVPVPDSRIMAFSAEAAKQVTYPVLGLWFVKYDPRYDDDDVFFFFLWQQNQAILAKDSGGGFFIEDDEQECGRGSAASGNDLSKNAPTSTAAASSDSLVPSQVSSGKCLECNERLEKSFLKINFKLDVCDACRYEICSRQTATLSILFLLLHVLSLSLPFDICNMTEMLLPSSGCFV